VIRAVRSADHESGITFRFPQVIVQASRVDSAGVCGNTRISVKLSTLQTFKKINLAKT
jgi:2-methylaconitate cis-trans-isomerase PrpF